MFQTRYSYIFKQDFILCKTDKSAASLVKAEVGTSGTFSEIAPGNTKILPNITL